MTYCWRRPASCPSRGRTPSQVSVDPTAANHLCLGCSLTMVRQMARHVAGKRTRRHSGLTVSEASPAVGSIQTCAPCLQECHCGVAVLQGMRSLWPGWLGSWEMQAWWQRLRSSCSSCLLLSRLSE